MAQQQVSNAQVQIAASAGVRLLEIKELPVPMEIAKSGALSVLEGILGALARGEVVLAKPPEPEEVSGPKLVPDSDAGKEGTVVDAADEAS